MRFSRKSITWSALPAGEGPGRLTAAVHVFKMVGLYDQVGPPGGPTMVEDVAQTQIRQALERTRTVLTEEDVRLAQQRRDSDRARAALTSLDLTPLGPLTSRRKP